MLVGELSIEDYDCIIRKVTVDEVSWYCAYVFCKEVSDMKRLPNCTWIGKANFTDLIDTKYYDKFCLGVDTSDLPSSQGTVIVIGRLMSLINYLKSK